MTAITLSVITSFIITFLIIPVIIKYSVGKQKMMDKPGRRKIHKKFTPSLGGIGIFGGIFAALIIWMPFSGFEQNKYILAGIGIIFALGIRDDIVPLKPLYKLFGQLIASLLIVNLSGIKLTSLYGLLGIYDIHPIIGSLLSIFTIIVITNSFNLIDGLDGLAGTIATIALSTFGLYFYLIDETIMSLIALTSVGAVLAFLTFNWEPSKIFMGDTGALVLGFIFSIMAIYFIDSNYGLPQDSPYKMDASIAVAVCIIIVPLFDTLRIFILRLWKRQSPFTPDKNHMHHALMRLGLSHSRTAMTLGLINIIYIVIGLSLHFLGDNILLPLIIILSIILSISLDKAIMDRVKRPKKAKIRNR